jgi:hypothetical protein
MDEEYLKRLGLSIARGVPQMATGFVDLAALPFTMTGLLEPEEAVGSTAYLTSKGLLPPPQEGVIPETLEMVSGAMSPGGAGKELLSGLLGVTAYHGGPRLFKQFDPAMAGRGEGAQYYGAGAGYGSEGRPLAEGYRERTKLKAQLEQTGKDQYNVIAPDGSVVASGVSKFDAKDAKSAYDAGAGYLYKGDIPDELVPQMLDRTKRFEDQPEAIKNVFTKLFNDPNVADPDLQEWFKRNPNSMAGVYYDTLATSDLLRGKQDVTNLLMDEGIPGIKYIDPASKASGENFMNYVVFRPEDFVVQEINDIPIEEWIKKGLLD